MLRSCRVWCPVLGGERGRKGSPGLSQPERPCSLSWSLGTLWPVLLATGSCPCHSRHCGNLIFLLNGIPWDTLSPFSSVQCHHHQPCSALDPPAQLPPLLSSSPLPQVRSLQTSCSIRKEIMRIIPVSREGTGDGTATALCFISSEVLLCRTGEEAGIHQTLPVLALSPLF